jgi:subtilisin family serine protease
LVTKQLDNASSVPLIGAPEVWEQYGIVGEGITVGIIDTGIDYLHTNFGGPGTPEAYAANNTLVTGDSPYFPSAKVAGGFDFAGDNYNADSDDPAAFTPQPDPDPADCPLPGGGPNVGHGTHVAGTAGGFGVNADGTTYTGPYTPDANFDALRIGPGVAARAQLYALRVFGCDGSTDVTELAIEYSVDPNRDGDFSDRLDVINMSLGSPYGTVFDSTAVASDNAAQAGVVVVASAGNEGDTYYVTGSPGTSTRTVSVASSVDAAEVFDGLRVNAPEAVDDILPVSYSVAYDFTTQPAVTGDVVYPPTQRSGCEPFTPENAALLAGKIALLDWTETAPGSPECGSATRTNNAADAGAIGVILLFDRAVLDTGITGSTRIPAAITASKEVSDELRANVDNGLNVTLSGEYNNTVKASFPEQVDTLSSFSSRGPRRGDNMLKPDIAAPGQSIFSTDANSGSGGKPLNGTSMAAPHIAGVMALLRELHPDWSVEELKALAMNTANNPVRSAVAQDSPTYAPPRAGAGRVDVPDAAASDVVAYNADDVGMVSVSFGDVEVVNSAQAVKKIRVLNKGDQAVTYAVEYRPLANIPGVEYTLSASTVTLQPFGSADVFVTMTATAAQMKHTRDQTVSDLQDELPRHWISEETGLVVMTRQGAPTLRVPVYVTARPASAMRAASNTLPVDNATRTEGAIELRGEDVLTGSNFPTDTISIVTAFELQQSSPNDARTPGLANNGDLRYVGVSTSVGSTESGAVEDSFLYFGLSTHGDWTTPREVEFDILFDTDKDGTDDYLLFHTDFGSVTGGDFSDVFITVLVNLDTGEASLQDFVNGVPASALDTVPFNTNVIVLPVFAGNTDDFPGLGLTSQNSSFNYRVVSYSLDLVLQDEEIDQDDPDGAFADRTRVLTYDAARPGLDLSNPELGGLPAHFDLNGNNIPFVYDPAAFAANRSQGALLLHHHNARDNRDEAIRQQGDFKLYLPVIIDNDGDFNN